LGTGNSSASGDNNDRYGVNSPRLSAKHPVNAIYADDNLLPPQNVKKKRKEMFSFGFR